MSLNCDVALIGAGRWGKNHVRTLSNLGVLHAICDTNEALLDLYQEQYPSVIVTTNYKHLLENSAIKKVVIAAPANLHYKMTKQALLSGKDVFVEKPLCLYLEEGEELIELAQRKGAILMVGHLLHFHPVVKKLFSLVDQGILGSLQYVVSNRLNLGPLRKEENVIWDLAPHDISLILRLFGNTLPESVQSFGGSYWVDSVEETGLLMLKFSQGRKAHIHTSWMHPFKEQKLTVIGSKGMAVFDDTQEWDQKLAVYMTPFTDAGSGVPQVSGSKVQYIVVEKKEPLKEELRHFCEAVHSKKAPLTDGREGVKVLKVLQAAEQSLKAQGVAISPFERIKPPCTVLKPKLCLKPSS